MKNLFIFLLLSTTIISCNSSIPYGIGTDPKLNLEIYTVGKEGGSFKVYSKIGHSLQIYPSDYKAKLTNKKYEGGIETIEGEWYKVVNPDLTDTIHITIDRNTSDTTRTIPLTIMSGNYGIQPKYEQK